MLKSFRFDSLFLFLILGIVFLWLAFPVLRGDFDKKEDFRITDLSVDEQLFFPEQGLIDADSIYLYNSNLSLLYSLDGGDNFIKADGSLIIKDLFNPNITLKNTSIRWRHPKGDFPHLISLIVKVQNEDSQTESLPKYLTYFTSIPSNLPIVHLTISENGLFDWDEGIMIAGESSSTDEGFYKEWWYRSSNFSERGSEWARHVQFQYFEKDQLLVEQPCEIKISGNATRYFPQKSLKFTPLNDEGKKDKIAYKFWQDKGNKKSKSILLRQGGNDNLKTLFADLLMHELAYESNIVVQNGFPVSTFINGNYWGIYNLRERVDDYFIAKNENVPTDSITILYCEVYGDKSLLKSGDKNVKASFDLIIDQLPVNRDLSKEEYELIKTQISTKSFIDYIFFETFYANQDWLHNNTTWYKAGHKKWKWLLNDLDYSLFYPGDQNLEANLFNTLKNSQSVTAKLFNSFMTTKKFKKKFKERTIELIETNFSDERIDSVLSTIYIPYQGEIERQINRWRSISSKEQWEKDVQNNVTFIKNRRTIYLKQVEDL